MFSLRAAQPAGGRGTRRQRWQGPRPGGRTPLPVATAGVTLVHTHAATRILTGVRTRAQCTHSHSHSHSPPHTHTHTHPLPRPLLQAAAALRGGAVAKDSRGGHCPGGGSGRTAEWALTHVRPEGPWEPRAGEGRIRSSMSVLMWDTVPSARIATTAGLRTRLSPQTPPRSPHCLDRRRDSEPGSRSRRVGGRRAARRDIPGHR